MDLMWSMVLPTRKVSSPMDLLQALVMAFLIIRSQCHDPSMKASTMNTMWNI